MRTAGTRVLGRRDASFSENGEKEERMEDGYRFRNVQK